MKYGVEHSVSVSARVSDATLAWVGEGANPYGPEAVAAMRAGMAVGNARLAREAQREEVDNDDTALAVEYPELSEFAASYYFCWGGRSALLFAARNDSFLGRKGHIGLAKAMERLILDDMNNGSNLAQSFLRKVLPADIDHCQSVRVISDRTAAFLMELGFHAMDLLRDQGREVPVKWGK